MIIHYLKIAVRSLTKYKQQTIISIVGLAIGFVCFALAILWIRYENSFDKFHPDYERIYAVLTKDETVENGMVARTPPPLAEKLKEMYPEIEAACHTSQGGYSLDVDNNFFKVFGIETEYRKIEDLLLNDNSVVVTDRFLEAIGPVDSLKVGDQITYKLYGEDKEAIIDEIIKAWPANTNFPFEIIKPLNEEDLKEWNVSYLWTFIKVREGIDAKAFKEKLESHKFTETIGNLSVCLVPVDEWYYTVSNSGRNIKYQYIILFSIAGLLVIFCALFNYLALFISRLRMRGKEMVLRKVNGASSWELLKQLLMEFLFVLALSVLLGFLIIEWVYPSFQELAAIKLSKFSVFSELAVYVFVLVVISLLVSLFPILHFRRSTLQSELGGDSVRSRGIFLRASIWIQFVVSIFFLYCTIVMIRQIYYLNSVDLGFDRKNVVQVHLPLPNDKKIAFLDELNKIPAIEQIAVTKSGLFLPCWSTGSQRVNTDDGKEVSVEIKKINPGLMDLMKFKIIKGKMINPQDGGILLNESAVSAIGETNVEMSLGRVQGVVQDFLFESPLMKSRPFMLVCDRNEDEIRMILYRFQEGSREQTQKAVFDLVRDKFDGVDARLFYMEDEYNNYLKTERAMVLLLSILSFICVMVALFGIYSMVSLSCERRRKEIAVRKVNGASTSSLLFMFLKEYFYMLVIASAVAFLLGYKVMQSWIESYINQIHIGVWIYLVIFAFIVLLISGITAFRIWRNIHANPASELKRE